MQVDEYWEEGDEGGEGALANLRGHTLMFAKDGRKGAMDKSDDVNDYVVCMCVLHVCVCLRGAPPAASSSYTC